MNFSRQALLGIGMIIGGSVMLYAMVQQIGDSNPPEPMSAMVEEPSTDEASPQPLTTDIETEKRILAQKQKERAARVAEQEKRAQEFLTEQEVAEAEALAKARAESQQYIANSAPVSNDDDSPKAAKDIATALTVQPRTDNESAAAIKQTNDAEKQKAAQEQQEAQRQAAIREQAAAKKLAESKKLVERKKEAEAERLAEAKKQAEAKKLAEAQAAAERKREAAEAAKNEPPKSPFDYQIQRGDGLIKLARQYNMPVEVLAHANSLSPSASLQLGQSITIPSKKQVQRLEREAAAAEQVREEKRQKEEALAKKTAEAKREAQQKLREARQEVKETDAKGSFGVQVALANDQARADDLAKKFQSAGYQVKTSHTSRGVRVIVGPERGKIAALALKDKINSDPKVNTTGAWVLYWR
ncbi:MULTISPECIES: LysM peptidoglycan-binding domain-containing protein [unclassified Psychrobacter]|uniref:LysM peptidoglycan-binding domain-containing protein n=1 Tax=unclassified Psychrobacter TaxID=196806 RepID=UPI0025B5DE02|nr:MULTISPECIES: LysM peptidoglycan-binding domain-containing protein [unclassified Psychrobacter]MDN3452239.1 SPOR domain-containing protein [Psychrobacter sp. APC 3350]MDN3502144.1 SPOR domain-containing protein [Psychrobacter sp. 5A.1]